MLPHMTSSTCCRDNSRLFEVAASYIWIIISCSYSRPVWLFSWKLSIKDWKSGCFEGWSWCLWVTVQSVLTAGQWNKKTLHSAVILQLSAEMDMQQVSPFLLFFCPQRSHGLVFSRMGKLNGTLLYHNPVSGDQGRCPFENFPPRRWALCFISQLPMTSVRNTRHPLCDIWHPSFLLSPIGKLNRATILPLWWLSKRE